MLILKDLPIILALFAAIFGTLGLVALTIPSLKTSIPNLKTGSLLYLLTATLLFIGLSLRNPKSTLEASLGLISPKDTAIELSIRPTATLSAALVKAELVSDPEGADVFIEDKLRGKTPFSLYLWKSTPISYRVTASPDVATGVRYKPFEGVLNQTQNSEISVWLDRIYP